RGPFIFDDGHTIVDNPYITSLKHIPGFFLPSPENAKMLEHSTWRPLWYTSFALNYHFSKLNSAAYHAVNIFLHFLCSATVYLMALLLLRGRAKRPWLAALLAGLFFAVHPLQTESVSYIVGRSSSMACLFYVAAFCLYVLYREKKNPALLILCCISFLLALMSKENSFIFPATVIAYELMFKGKGERPVAGVAVIAAMAAAFVALRYYVIYLNPATGLPGKFYIYWTSQVYVISQYIFLIFFPASLNIDHNIAGIVSLLEPRFFLSAAFLCIIFYGLYRLSRRDRLACFLLLWFFIALVPETFIPIADLMAERRTYLPLAGVSVLFGLWLEAAITRGTRVWFPLPGSAWAALAVAVLLTFSVISIERNKVYTSESAIWGDSARKAPDQVRPLTALGLALWKEGRTAEALKVFRRAIELDPKFAPAQYNFADLCKNQNMPDLALQHYQKALELEPDDSQYLNGIGKFYFEMGDYTKALEYYHRAILRNPDYLFAHLNLGNLYLTREKGAEAARELEKAIELDPNLPVAHSYLGAAYLMMGKYQDAVRESAESLRLNPGDPFLYLNMAAASEHIGDKKQAIEYYKQFLQLAKPDDPRRPQAEAAFQRLLLP
ncbi:MAG TPA: tetratricopeptide repeat protein, partial [Nitrospirota bacterium]